MTEDDRKTNLWPTNFGIFVFEPPLCEHTQVGGGQVGSQPLMTSGSMGAGYHQ